MATVREEEMAAKNDCQYVRALDANGNSIRISKEDLAKVLGGLMQASNLFPFMNRGAASDANKAELSGYYQVYEPSANFPGGISYGVLVVSACEGYILQMCVGNVNSPNNTAYVRLRDGSGNWRNWRSF